MTDLLVAPLKKPSEVDVVKPLKNLIQSAYANSSSTGSPVDYSECVNEFGKLRNTAIWKFFEKYQTSLDIVYGYYDQICSLETKIPVYELQIPFKWKDAFDKGSLFGGRISLTLTSLSYEKVCVLFNIAALQSAVAAAQSTESDEGLKLATKLFQQSSGIFAHLKGITPAAISQEPTPDLNPETLHVLSNLMIAQAQEIFVIKAIRDNMKDAIIAKLACQCEELYAEAMRGLQKDSLRTLWDKEWIPTIAGKQAGFHAMTQLYQSLVCRSNKAVGEEIARLQQSVELFKAAQSRSGKPTLFEEYAHRAQRNLTESKKDNDLIYNEMIPDVKSLDSPGKALLAKPTAVTSRFLEGGKDLFVALVPVALHQALTACESRKNEIVNGEILKLREATQTLNGVLASLNLPAAIEVTSSGSLPPSLLEKANAVRDRGGITSIRNVVTELPELLTRNREILDETERMLNDEKESDDKLRTQFKTRWTRTPSDKLTETFRSNLGKYREVINTAVNADKIVREKFERNSHGIEMLSKSPAELEQAIPSGGGSNVSACSSVQRLWKLMEQVGTVKAERDVIETEFKSATIDIKDQFLSALAQDGAINEPALSVSSIGKTLGPLQQQAQQSIGQQEQLIRDIQSAHEAFMAESGNANGSRETFFSELASAHNYFTELQDNLKEGIKFYNHLTELLVALQNKITDYCFARKTEKDELLKDLTHESSRTPAAAPAIPAQYGGGNAPATPAQPPSSAPYPSQVQGMPVPYGASSNAPYPTYVPPPMPSTFNPYATLPYPQNAYNYQNFPQGPPMQQYGTYPGNYAHMQQQQPPMPGYPGQPPYPGYPQQ